MVFKTLGFDKASFEQFSIFLFKSSSFADELLHPLLKEKQIDGNWNSHSVCDYFPCNCILQNKDSNFYYFIKFLHMSSNGFIWIKITKDIYNFNDKWLKRREYQWIKKNFKFEIKNK